MLLEIEAVDPAALWTSFGHIAKKDYWFFLRIILNFRWMDPGFHGEEVFRFLEYLDEEKKDGLVLMPRGTGKSGMITSAMPAWWLARNPDLCVGVVNAAETKGKRYARTSANIMSKNKLYQWAFPDVKTSSKWGDDGFFLDTQYEDQLTTIERLDPSLAGYGIGGNFTGAHHDGGVILDDLINATMARSKGEVKKAQLFFGEAINCIDPGVPLRICATRWTYHDYCGMVERGEIEGRNGRIEVLKLGATRKVKKPDGKIVEELIWPLQTWIDDRGDVHECGMSFEHLNAFKKNLKGLFSALYYNEPVMDEDCAFALEFLKRYRGLKHLEFELGPVHRVAIECESQAASLINTFTAEMRRQRKRMPIEKVQTKGQSKEERILSVLQTPVKEGLFNMREDTYQRDDSLLEEMKSFPKGHDDQLDAHAYCYEMCLMAPKNDEFPPVCIACDPAFTEEDHSDYTAIAVGCIYQGEYYELETMKFQTNRTDNIVRMVFNIFDKFDNLAFSREKKSKRTSKSGFSSYQAPARTRTRRGRRRRGKWSNNESFEVDLSSLVVDLNQHE